MHLKPKPPKNKRSKLPKASLRKRDPFLPSHPCLNIQIDVADDKPGEAGGARFCYVYGGVNAPGSKDVLG
jgi:hypothetical protein